MFNEMARSEHVASSPLPQGVVTFLFTDMVGSSRLWEQHGDHFIPVWQSHDAVVRDAAGRFGGAVVKGEGDSFMIAFEDAAAAVHCAVYAQAALGRYPWPAEIGAVHVRMGIHTGEPFCYGHDYFGPVVNRAANIQASAHGGQILVSEDARMAAFSGVNADVEFVDLGDHRLKDMGSPTRLFQVTHPSMRQTAFPPPSTLEGQPNNLPLLTTSFVGRSSEIAQIASFLGQGGKPVLTLTGPDGIGKTRLSLQAAAAHAEWFPDGIWYVRLVEARDVPSAAEEIAAALHIPSGTGPASVTQVRTWLAHRECLLILDDVGSLPHADRLIRELLSGSPNLRCLATARESLDISESDELALQGLSHSSKHMVNAGVGGQSRPVGDRSHSPKTAQKLDDTEAGRLFIERLAAAHPNTRLSLGEATSVTELIRELDGVPMHIERAVELMDRMAPSAVLEWLRGQLTQQSETPSHTAMNRMKSFFLKGADKVRDTTRSTAKQLGQLLQGIADVATDRGDTSKAHAIGHASLRQSEEAGDELGFAASLRQLARLKWRQGEHKRATEMLAMAVDIFRHFDAVEYTEAQRELDLLYSQMLASDASGNEAPLAPHTTWIELDDHHQ